MIKECYISRLRMNFKIAETVIDGQHIVIDDETFELLSRPPANRRPVQRLFNEATNTRITIYS